MDTLNKKLILAILVTLLTFLVFDLTEARADTYFSVDLGTVNYSGGDYGGDWDSNGGIPARLELGYKFEPLQNFIGNPVPRVQWLHLSNFEGAIIGDLLDTNSESQVDFVGIGLCWGDC